MKMLEIPIDKPFRIVDNQWFSQFIFARIDHARIQNLDTGHIGDINLFLECEEIVGEFKLNDPERLKNYYAKREREYLNGAGKSFI